MTQLAQMTRDEVVERAVAVWQEQRAAAAAQAVLAEVDRRIARRVGEAEVALLNDLGPVIAAPIGGLRRQVERLEGFALEVQAAEVDAALPEVQTWEATFERDTMTKLTKQINLVGDAGGRWVAKVERRHPFAEIERVRFSAVAT